MEATAQLINLLSAARATIYTRSAIGGLVKTEVRDLVVEEGPYAQCDRALKVTFVPKGKRNRRGAWLTYEPTLLVADGWGAPELPDAFVQTGPMTSRARHLGYAPEWEEEARDVLQGVELIFDAKDWGTAR